MKCRKSVLDLDKTAKYKMLIVLCCCCCFEISATRALMYKSLKKMVKNQKAQQKKTSAFAVYLKIGSYTF